MFAHAGHSMFFWWSCAVCCLMACMFFQSGKGLVDFACEKCKASHYIKQFQFSMKSKTSQHAGSMFSVLNRAFQARLFHPLLQVWSACLIIWRIWSVIAKQLNLNKRSLLPIEDVSLRIWLKAPLSPANTTFCGADSSPMSYESLWENSLEDGQILLSLLSLSYGLSALRKKTFFVIQVEGAEWSQPQIWHAGRPSVSFAWRDLLGLLMELHSKADRNSMMAGDPFTTDSSCCTSWRFGCYIRRYGTLYHSFRDQPYMPRSGQHFITRSLQIWRSVTQTSWKRWGQRRQTRVSHVFDCWVSVVMQTFGIFGIFFRWKWSIAKKGSSYRVGLQDARTAGFSWKIVIWVILFASER